ncbi:BppU family phage baseplate upper protein [Natrinema pallidum]|uniref:DUF2479 domain-containing protein n=1 Tax=Natrinema pallidum TaxID=69527 RepID=A0A4P9THI4_9EURY|nr:BppU family phage baseplate upper protein [Natrinema pallidum]QCW03575.1 DUF2479 domain-containing protein [Natrinema pallidum]
MTNNIDHTVEPVLEIKAGDDRPSLEWQATRGRLNPEPVDLTDASSVRIYLQNQETGDLLVNAEAEIVDATNGELRYEFAEGDTVQTGENHAEFVVNYTDGDGETFPSNDFLVVWVDETLDREIGPADLDEADATVGVLTADEVRTDLLSVRSEEAIGLGAPVDAAGNDITGTGAIEGQSASISGQVDATSASVEQAEINPNGPMPGVGEVQSAIDDVAASGNPGIVKLRPGVDYGGGGDFPWSVKSGVTLDYNGAFVDKQTDTDIVHVEGGATVRDPRHTLSNITFTSTVFRYSGNFGSYEMERRTRVEGGLTVGTVGQGTLHYLTDDGSGVVFVSTSHQTNGIGTVYDLHHNGSGFINGNRFEGKHRHYETGIHHHGSGTGEINANVYGGTFQPTPDSNKLMHQEIGANTVIRALTWDPGTYGTSTPWEITGGGRTVLFDQVSAWDETFTSSTENSNNAIVRLDSGGRIKQIYDVDNGHKMDQRFDVGFMQWFIDGTYTLSVGEGSIDLKESDLRGMPKYTDDANAPADSLYYDTTDGQLEYKDSGGTIHPLG